MKRRDCLIAMSGALGAFSLLALPAFADSDGNAFPASAAQGALVVGKIDKGYLARYRGRELRATPYGSVVLGIGRNETDSVSVEVTDKDGRRQDIFIAVTTRDFPTEYVSGVPPKTVNPPPAIAARIAREQALVAAARERDDDRADFADKFIWPVRGRISGRFGNQRVYNGKPGSGHSGMDIAVATGTPVKAPASGIISFADPDLYLTGGTVLLDHGHGVSSNFLHLSRIDGKVGDRIKQGEVFAAVGSTGRATGPHLHWGMSWFDVRVDPQLLVDA